MDATISAGENVRDSVSTPVSARPQPKTAALRDGMMGYMLPQEQFTVPQPVDIGTTAAAAGFDFLASSDHFQPWQANKAHSGAAWVPMAAPGARAQKTTMGTFVTCPTLRYCPAVVAEAFASLSLLYPGRIFLGVGSGEALNEQAATGLWPDWGERRERLIEAIGIIRRLWTGQHVSHRGKYYAVDARLYDPPAAPFPIRTAANDEKAIKCIPVDEQVEVLSLIGDVAFSDGEPTLHIHAVLGKSDGSVVGGHLLSAEIRPTLEVVVTQSPSYLRKAKDDPEAGLALLAIDPVTQS